MDENTHAESALAAARQVLDRLDKHEQVLLALTEQFKRFAEVLANHNAILEKVTGFQKPEPTALN
jgi:ethanolamine utilization protein EutA (predicted chaperonin)